MLTIIQYIISSITNRNDIQMVWGNRPSAWDYFRAEYKDNAQGAYDYWASTGRFNFQE